MCHLVRCVMSHVKTLNAQLWVGGINNEKGRLCIKILYDTCAHSDFF